MKDKWMYLLTNSEVWEGAEFDTKEEAIIQGRKEVISEGLDVEYFEVGQIEEITVSGIDVDSIIENVAENTTNNVYEVGDEYLCDISKEQCDELEEKLNEVLFAWIKKHKLQPEFFSIKNIENIKI